MLTQCYEVVNFEHVLLIMLNTLLLLNNENSEIVFSLLIIDLCCLDYPKGIDAEENTYVITSITLPYIEEVIRDKYIEDSFSALLVVFLRLAVMLSSVVSPFSSLLRHHDHVMNKSGNTVFLIRHHTNSP